MVFQCNDGSLRHLLPLWCRDKYGLGLSRRCYWSSRCRSMRHTECQSSRRMVERDKGNEIRSARGRLCWRRRLSQWKHKVGHCQDIAPPWKGSFVHWIRAFNRLLCPYKSLVFGGRNIIWIWLWPLPLLLPPRHIGNSSSIADLRPILFYSIEETTDVWDASSFAVVP